MLDFHFGNYWGYDTKRVTWNILAHMFHNDVGRKISWKGLNGKKSFRQMAAKTFLLHAVRKSPISRSATDEDITKPRYPLV
ncbi:hypothetical protein UPYG_G00010730 [Umbra pygmaea]|uniref:Uncharacterized protein n=1 Tax=Umbra pygmaea TaxID=75934 RepID=A0ABD0XIH9_UMBPY